MLGSYFHEVINPDFFKYKKLKVPGKACRRKFSSSEDLIEQTQLIKAETFQDNEVIFHSGRFPIP